MKRHYHRRLILIGWLFFAVTTLFIWASTWLPAALQLPFVMLTAMFTVPLTMEFSLRGVALQMLCTTLVCALRFGLGVIAPYALFLGYYPPVKFLCEQQGGVTGLLLKLMTFCLAFGIIMRLFPEPLFTAYANLPWYGFIAALIAMFVFADIAVTLFAAAYNSALRKRLL
jgi:hypothetical protein